MDAAILAIGDELTTGGTADTNSSWLAARLAARGVDVIEIRCVDDDRRRIARAIDDLMDRCQVLLITGGLGPTEDDLTREALGDVLSPGEPLITDAAALRRLETWFARSGTAMPGANRRQAMHPRGTELIRNRHGTAPGLIARTDACLILVLPGVPREMKALYDELCDEILPHCDEGTMRLRTVHTQGLGESTVAERLGELMARDRSPRIGTTSAHSMVSVRIYARGRINEASLAAERDAQEVERRLFPYAFGRDENTLADALGGLLRDRNLTITAAESCTGGMVGGLITETPGSSDYFVGGFITYSNELKEQLLNVPREALEAHGAVSEPVARAMAEGAIRAAGADVAIAVTGIAGPGGGTAEKPVGTVYIATAQRRPNVDDGDSTNELRVRCFRFRGTRRDVRERATLAAVQMMRLHLMEVLDETPLLWQPAEQPHHARECDSQSDGNQLSIGAEAGGNPKIESPRKKSPRRESPRNESPRNESPRNESPRNENRRSERAQ